MRIASAADYGYLARDRRVELELSQAELAERAGVTRQWLVRFEQGSTETTVAKVQAVLRALDLVTVVLVAEPGVPTDPSPDEPPANERAQASAPGRRRSSAGRRDSPLHILLHGRHVARLMRGVRDEFRLEYEPEASDDLTTVPVSLSLPLAKRVHRGEAVWNFVDNLLPDSPQVRERWATRAGLTRADPFELLAHYGQDVAGAVWFRRDGSPDIGERRPVDDEWIARRIREARADATAWHDDTRAPEGQFSLSGAQTKFSLARHEGDWFETSGAAASTHIVKPCVHGVPDGEIVEFITMRAAARLGIPAAAVELTRFGDQHALVVERFDRVQDSAPTLRLHQEDLAQALGTPRLAKYEVHGGPSIDAIARLLAETAPLASDDSRKRFARVLAFSWIVLHTDSHAKNHSVFLDPGGARLTPLYDASSVIPYLGAADLDEESLLARAAGRSLAFRYGASAVAGEIGGFELGAIARRCGMPSAELLEATAQMCDALPAVVEEIAAGLPAEVRSEVVERYVRWMPLRAEQARASLLSA
ncbi:HipA domain-containing protein [Herbiconiux moechotypicola]|uniref:HTH cro/C1-type domain-containing protein n=1 Tax=Herbiconiux moechotypicola TaxID=637393 RepID=A0ABP5QFV2_9MICO|nr:HipA domain-containing protein [Herbiconiux moechotypicola]MCS5729927.1 HipA domain-containing protein [Herbiconiux moechotypicola]